MRQLLLYLRNRKERIMDRKLEILAPAGSFESLKAAVMAGADAVYMGGSRFGARAYAENPQGDRLLEAIDYAHLYRIKIYLTVNTLLKERELERELYDYLLPCYEHGLDAVIVQDVGVIQAIREWFPDLPVHASTQMTLCGSGGVKLLQEMGVRRAVLAREISLAEIAKIYKDTGMELECFVHGALCYCYSGQCLFSSILGGRSGNRGRCAQPCRLAYQALAGGKRPPVKGEGTLLSLKDLCAIDQIPGLAEAGVFSLKIEGRMKRPEYTAGIVRIYRKYVDQYLKKGAEGCQVSEEDRKELLLLFNRDGFSQGYFQQHNGRDMIAFGGNGQAEREKGDYEGLIRFLHEHYVETEKKIPVKGRLYAGAGVPLKLELMTAEEREGQVKLTVFGDCPQLPRNCSMEARQIEKQLKKTGNTPFVWTGLEIRTEGPLFVPVQALNALRREAFAQLKKELTAGKQKGTVREPEKESAAQMYRESVREPEERTGAAEESLHISVETKEQLAEVLAQADRLKEKDEFPLSAVCVEADDMEEELLGLIRQIHGRKLRAFVMLPPVFRMQTAERYEKKADFWSSLPADGYILRNLEEYEYLCRVGWKKEMILDHNVYTFNRRSSRYWREKGVRLQTNPLELNRQELSEISSGDRIQIIYGRYPMMVTAGCLHRTLGRCRHRQETWYLKDRYQKEFPVKNFCRDCYNIIYNSRPLYLLDLMGKSDRVKAGAYRIMFTTEDREEVKQVLNLWMEHQKSPRSFTRGHYKRGVE